MMTASGLAAVISNDFVTISNEYTFPIFVVYCAGLVNIFVPSRGRSMGVQGVIELGVSIHKTAMAVAWGDAWTNLIQLFWVSVCGRFL